MLWSIFIVKAMAAFQVRARLGEVEIHSDIEYDHVGLSVAAQENLLVLGNADQLRRVLSSLLGSALHYLHEGGSIHVSAHSVFASASATDDFDAQAYLLRIQGMQ